MMQLSKQSAKTSTVPIPNAVPAVFVAPSRVTRAGVNRDHYAGVRQGCTRPSLAIGNATLSIRRELAPSAACLCLCIFNQST